MISKLKRILEDVELEIISAQMYFGPFNSAHEGYAVIKEEFDELWANVMLNQRKNPDRLKLIREEAIQVAAMAIRLIHDCCDINE